MVQDEKEFDEVYSDDGRESLIENDSLSMEEDAFMQGYDELSDNVDDFDEDADYEEAFKKKVRRAKRKDNIFDEEELEADTLLK